MLGYPPKPLTKEESAEKEKSLQSLRELCDKANAENEVSKEEFDNLVANLRDASDALFEACKANKNFDRFTIKGLLR